MRYHHVSRRWGRMSAQSEGRVAHIVEMAKDPATKPDCIPVDMLTTNLDSYDAGEEGVYAASTASTRTRPGR